MSIETVVTTAPPCLDTLVARNKKKKRYKAKTHCKGNYNSQRTITKHKQKGSTSLRKRNIASQMTTFVNNNLPCLLGEISLRHLLCINITRRDQSTFDMVLYVVMADVNVF